MIRPDRFGTLRGVESVAVGTVDVGAFVARSPVPVAQRRGRWRIEPKVGASE
jgi:hypothetical protein